MRVLSSASGVSHSRFWLSADRETCLHKFEYFPGQLECPPHTHPDYNIIICQGPQMDCYVHGRRVTLDAAEILVLNPGDPHCGRYGGDFGASCGLTLHISPRALKAIMYQMRLPWDYEREAVLFAGQKVHDPKALSLAQEQCWEIERKRPGYELVLGSLVVQLVVHLLRNCIRPTFECGQADTARQLTSWQMVRTVEFMSSSGKSEFNIDRLCAEVGVSSSHFTRLFKNSMNGVSPNAAFNQLLMARAGRLLKQSDYLIKEVAHDLGFKNESHFCCAFRRCFGITPKQFQFDPRSGAV